MTQVNVAVFTAHKNIPKGSFGVKEIRLTRTFRMQQTVYTIEFFDHEYNLFMSFEGTPRKIARFKKLLNNIDPDEVIDRITL